MSSNGYELICHFGLFHFGSQRGIGSTTVVVSSKLKLVSNTAQSEIAVFWQFTLRELSSDLYGTIL